PVKTIRLIQELLPQLKLVFLLRDPAVEAWQAWQESQQYGQSPGTVLETWPWARADLLGQLRRWKSAFPADQFFIGFEEQIDSERVAQLTRLFSTAVKHEFDDVYLFRAVQGHEEDSRCLLQSPAVPTLPPRNADNRAFNFNPEQVPVYGDELPLLVREGYRGF